MCTNYIYWLQLMNESDNIPHFHKLCKHHKKAALRVLCRCSCRNSPEHDTAVLTPPSIRALHLFSHGQNSQDRTNCGHNFIYTPIFLQLLKEKKGKKNLFWRIFFLFPSILAGNWSELLLFLLNDIPTHNSNKNFHSLKI